MNSLRHHEIQLSHRRMALVVQCRQQRTLLQEHGRELGGLIKVLDGAVSVASGIRRHPGIALGMAVAVIAVVKPRRFLFAFRNVLTALRSWSAVAPVLRSLR